MFDISINQADSKNFYPTPAYLVDKMMSKVDWHKVVDVLVEYKNKSRGTYDKKINIDCIEIDTNMQHILRGNNFKVVHDDFLSYNSYKKYDLIIMNPPFDCGDKHLLKALEIQKRGGQIVCLLNADTLLNLCTNARKDLVKKLNNLDANIEFIDDAFYNAERKTSVKTALIYVNIKEDKTFKDESFIYNELKKAQEIKQEDKEKREITDKLAFLEQIVEQYNFEVEGGIKLIREYIAFKPYIRTGFEKIDPQTGEKIKDYSADKAMLTLSVGSYVERSYDQTININDYVKLVRTKYWQALFSNDEFTKNLTSNLIEEYRNNINKLDDYDFTIFNIKTLQMEMSKNMIQGVEKTILDLFDSLSQKVSYWDTDCPNIHYYNGWKTNKAHMINKKVIIPYSANIHCSYKYVDQERVAYNYFSGTGLDKIKDMEKVFNYLDGGLTDDVNIEEILAEAAKNGQTRKIPLKYFNVTFYKKGTCHIEFTNLELLKKFNIYSSQRRGWLPPVYAKKSYKDMSQEEQCVIDSFEGEKEYNKIMANKTYYITDTANLLALPEAI